MCGIIGYIGSNPAREIIINGLKRLEYRGYDSAGMALVNSETRIFKCAGRVKDLELIVNKSKFNGKTGIGHTRWATHGEPNELNAHPQISYKGNFIVVHNGIIENYARLKKHLESRGIVFTSQTDTEVLANLIEHVYLEADLTAEQAITLALNRVEGAYGLVIICTRESDRLFAAKKSSPLVIGVGEGENFIASDATPIVEYTQRVIYLNDDDIAIIKKDELILKTIRNEMIQPVVKELDLKIGEIDKEGFDHFMLKEIFEQPRAIHDTFRGRVLPDLSGVMLGGLHNVLESISRSERIIIIACGTSWHAGLLGEYIFEEYTRIPVEVEYASEFRYRNPIINKGDIVLAISQSGETADTLAAVKLAKEKGAIVIGICNVVGSSIPRETYAGVFQHTRNALYLGRGYLFPVALEGALKLKEISYIHAEGYPAAEMKHGPIALIDENMPVVVVATKDDTYEKIISNIQEIKARKGNVIAIVTEGDEIISKMADYVLEVPETIAAFSGLLAVIPLQLFSYHIAVLRGCNVDQPRNLAKSVTVE